MVAVALSVTRESKMRYSYFGSARLVSRHEPRVLAFRSRLAVVAVVWDRFAMEVLVPQSSCVVPITFFVKR